MKDLVFIDLETTGLDSKKDKITEITIRVGSGEKPTEVLSTLLNPGIAIPKEVSDLTGITNEMVYDKPTFNDIAKHVKYLLKDKIIVGHNVKFDISFLDRALLLSGIEIGEPPYICTCETERNSRGRSGNKLCECLARRGIKTAGFHRSRSDVEATVNLYNSQVKEGKKILVKKYSRK